MNMSVSQTITENGKKKIYIRFEEDNRFAEGIYPDCEIIKSDGFDDGEIAALKLFMSQSGEKIQEMAKSVSIWKAFTGENF